MSVGAGLPTCELCGKRAWLVHGTCPDCIRVLRTKYDAGLRRTPNYGDGSGVVGHASENPDGSLRVVTKFSEDLPGSTKWIEPHDGRGPKCIRVDDEPMGGFNAIKGDAWVCDNHSAAELQVFEDNVHYFAPENEAARKFQGVSKGVSIRGRATATRNR